MNSILRNGQTSKLEFGNRRLKRFVVAGLLLCCIALLPGCGARQAADTSKGVIQAPVANKAQTLVDSCPAQNFPEFLRMFASQSAVRDTFTAERLWVQEFSDPDTYAVARVQVDKAKYSGFNLVATEDGFHESSGGDSADTTPIKVDIQRQDDASYAVSYEFGSSEGKSYLFVPRKNCWVLAEDMTAPSP